MCIRLSNPYRPRHLSITESFFKAQGKYEHLHLFKRARLFEVLRVKAPAPCPGNLLHIPHAPEYRTWTAS